MAKIIKIINSLFGIGYLPGGGTCATIATFILYQIFLLQHKRYLNLLLIILATIFIFLNTKIDKMKDPSYVVTDEFIGTLFGLNILSVLNGPFKLSFIFNFVSVLIFLILFRFFDIKKPFGIKKIEKLPGAFGIILDDIVAALYALISSYFLTIIFYIIYVHIFYIYFCYINH